MSSYISVLFNEMTQTFASFHCHMHIFATDISVMISAFNSKYHCSTLVLVWMQPYCRPRKPASMQLSDCPPLWCERQQRERWLQPCSSVLTQPSDCHQRGLVMLASSPFPALGRDVRIGASHRWNMKDTALTKWQPSLIHTPLITYQHHHLLLAPTLMRFARSIYGTGWEREWQRGGGGGKALTVNRRRSRRGKGGCAADAEAMNDEQDGSAMNGKDWRRPVIQTHAGTYTHLDTHTQDRRKD